jgi:hypothetical protein
MAFTGKPPDARRLAQQRWAEEYGWLFLSSPGGGVADPYAGFLFYDHFNDTPDADITAHVPDKQVGENLWVPGLGAWKSNGTALALDATAGDGQATCVYDMGVADLTLVTSVTVGASFDVRIVANFTDQDNLWICVISPNAFAVYARTGGGFGVPVDSGVIAIGAGTHILRVVPAGDTISFYVNDALVSAITQGGGRSHKTATKHGVSIYAPTDTTAIFNYFSAAA